MLHIGQVDLRCFASSGQNGGALPGTMWLVPDDGNEHWNAATRDKGRLEGLPWVVFTCSVADFVPSWYGVVGQFGKTLAALNIQGDVEIARCPVNAVQTDMELLARVYRRLARPYRDRPIPEPTCFDAFRVAITMSGDLPTFIMIMSDAIMEGSFEYVSRVIQQEVTPILTNEYQIVRLTEEQIAASRNTGAEFTSTVTIEEA